MASSEGAAAATAGSRVEMAPHGMLGNLPIVLLQPRQLQTQRRHLMKRACQLGARHLQEVQTLALDAQGAPSSGKGAGYDAGTTFVAPSHANPSFSLDALSALSSFVPSNKSEEDARNEGERAADAAKMPITPPRIETQAQAVASSATFAYSPEVLASSLHCIEEEGSSLSGWSESSRASSLADGGWIQCTTPDGYPTGTTLRMVPRNGKFQALAKSRDRRGHHPNYRLGSASRAPLRCTEPSRLRTAMMRRLLPS